MYNEPKFKGAKVTTVDQITNTSHETSLGQVDHAHRILDETAKLICQAAGNSAPAKHLHKGDPLLDASLLLNAQRQLNIVTNANTGLRMRTCLVNTDYFVLRGWTNSANLANNEIWQEAQAATDYRHLWSGIVWHNSSQIMARGSKYYPPADILFGFTQAAESARLAMDSPDTHIATQAANLYQFSTLCQAEHLVKAGLFAEAEQALKSIEPLENQTLLERAKVIARLIEIEAEIARIGPHVWREGNKTYHRSNEDTEIYKQAVLAKIPCHEALSRFVPLCAIVSPVRY